MFMNTGLIRHMSNFNFQLMQQTLGMFVVHLKTMQAGQWGFIEYRPPNKKPEYRPNIDHTALYRPNIDRKISLKNEYYRN